MKAQNSKQEFERLYRDAYSLVYNYVFRMLLDRTATEDVVAEAFFKAARSFDRFDASCAKFSTWVVAIARNCVSDYFRARKAEEPLDDAPAAAVAKEDASIEHVHERDAVVKLLAVLDIDERALVFMKYFEGKRNVDIAEELGVNASTVSTRLARALSKMRASSEGVL